MKAVALPFVAAVHAPAAAANKSQAQPGEFAKQLSQATSKAQKRPPAAQAQEPQPPQFQLQPQAQLAPAPGAPAKSTLDDILSALDGAPASKQAPTNAPASTNNNDVDASEDADSLDSPAPAPEPAIAAATDPHASITAMPTAQDTDGDKSDADRPPPDDPSLAQLTSALAAPAAHAAQAQAQPAAPAHAPAIAPAAPAAPIAPPALPELTSAHHARIVLGDAEHQVVMTVAIRGSSVSVALRTPDDHTSAALSRNASMLDEAMHRRGLSLDHFQAEPDLDQPRQPRDPEPDANSPQESADAEPFTLEETA